MSSIDRWIDNELQRLSAEGLRRQRSTVRPLAGGWCEVDGQQLLNFAGNDYLGLAGDARVISAARTALEESGSGARASALVTGRTPWHVRLEERLADFEGTAAAILFPSGYAANVGTLRALIGPKDLVLCDRLNHASLVDGCRSSGARFRVYRHGDIEQVERELQRATGARHRWIVTDGIFSMDGDLAPLRALCDIAEQHDAAILVDEAHGTGVLGQGGRGSCELLEVESRVTVRVGTLSKAIGSLGGFVVGPQPLIDLLWNSARTQMFSTALPPAVCAAALESLRLIDQEPWRRETVLSHAAQLRSALNDAGLTLPESEVTPITPVLLTDPDSTLHAAQELRQRGFLVGAIRPPTVPRGTSRLRVTLSAAHTAEDVDRLAAALIDVLPADRPRTGLRPPHSSCR